jgi:hypothetical protein
MQLGQIAALQAESAALVIGSPITKHIMLKIAPVFLF